VFDIAVAVAAVMVFAIPALLIAIAVRVTSSGPIFFRHQRVGRNGQLFSVMKFRSMRDGTHAEVISCDVAKQAYRDNDFKLPPNDPRITSIGKILRKTSLDELPQLLNVIRGDMSIVGVRPLLAEEVALRPSYDQRLYELMRPGMTGLWQVEGRSTVGKTDRLALDRRYLEDWSLWADVKIALRTPYALLRIHHAH
jgi:lipopolysaccharide/colanic/teichoic acid biosynthesis glycosyltransferase